MSEIARLDFMKMINVTTPRCRHCRKSTSMPVEKQAYEDWLDGKNIAQAFPNLSANDREFLKTGIHPKCWDILFAED